MNKAELSERTNLIDKYLDKYLVMHDLPQKIIYEAMRYSVFAGGKRLRPILMTEVFCMCGGNAEEIMPFACAMEMIHTYSLIHDDLPAMDNDDLRRGKATSHIKFGEATAILAGDALLTKAFETAAQYKGNDMAKTITAIGMLAKSAGTEGMIGGQIIDIESENKKIDINELEYLHLLKTGAIIRSSCTIGALLAGASDEEMNAVDDFAKNLGIAFQIRDDILDVTGNEEELGKPIGSDAAEHKNTYVTLLGLEKAKKLVKQYSDNAQRSLDIFGKSSDFLKELTCYLVNRNS